MKKHKSPPESLSLDDIYESDTTIPDLSQRKKDLFNRLKHISKESHNFESYNAVKKYVGTPLSNNSRGSVHECLLDNNQVIKQSQILGYIDKMSQTADDSITEQLHQMLDTVETEPKNMYNYMRLKTVFPDNIISIYKHFRCRNIDHYQDNYIMERVFGTTLKNYIDKFEDVDLFQLNIISLYLQCIYITMYSNLIGLFHNDIKSNNIMVDLSPRRQLLMDVLILTDKKVLLKIQELDNLLCDYNLLPTYQILPFLYIFFLAENYFLVKIQKCFY